MSSPYKRMFVLNEDEYEEYKRFKASQVPVGEPALPTVSSPREVAARHLHMMKR